MKTTKILMSAFVVGSLFLITSCGAQSAKKTADSVETKSVEVSKNMSIDDLLSEADNNIGNTVAVEGICTHICKHGGKKIFLMGSDDTKTIRVEAAKVGRFKQECVNAIVELKGTLCEERIDESYLKQWETRVEAAIADQHGAAGEGCDTEKKARGEVGRTESERIADFRKKIAQRKAENGKEYLLFYYIDAVAYEIQ